MDDEGDEEDDDPSFGERKKKKKLAKVKVPKEARGGPSKPKKRESSMIFRKYFNLIYQLSLHSLLARTAQTPRTTTTEPSHTRRRSLLETLLKLLPNLGSPTRTQPGDAGQPRR